MERGLSLNTINAYQSDLFAFFEFIGIQGGIELNNLKRKDYGKEMDLFSMWLYT